MNTYTPETIDTKQHNFFTHLEDKIEPVPSQTPLIGVFFQISSGIRKDNQNRPSSGGADLKKKTGKKSPAIVPLSMTLVV
jgi:hypothetical protein